MLTNTSGRIWLTALAVAAGLSLSACDDDEGGGGTADAAGGVGGEGGGGAGGAGGGGEGGGGAGGNGNEGGGGEGGGGPGFDVTIPGLSGPTTVFFDAQGVLHARCATNADCYRVEGYYHAAHRFSQMDIRRRLVRGQLSAAVGNILIDLDAENRRWYADPATGDELAQKMLASASPDTRAALEAYAAGVNAWIAQARAGNLPTTDEYDFELIDKQAALRDWEPIDSAACILALLDSLTNQSGTEIFMGEVYGTLPFDLAEDTYGLKTGSLATVLPVPETKKAGDAPGAEGAEPEGAKAEGPEAGRAEGAARLDRAAAEALGQRLARHRAQFSALAKVMPDRRPDVTALGSNNWAVHPSQTANGKALLANDPHLGLSNPAVWYVVHLDAKTAGTGDLHVAGVSFAGLPGIILGQNEHIAWGATTTYFDMADVYQETLAAEGTATRFNGADVPILTREVEIEVAGGNPEMRTLAYVPHHGPILALDADEGIATSARWVGHEGGTDLDFLLTMPRSTTVLEARENLKVLTTVGQNFMVADTAGNIGWFPYNTIPNRPWNSRALPSWLPLPGDGTAEWQGFVPFEDLPQAYNPAEGFVATANNDMTGHLADGDPTNDGQAAIQHFVAFGLRQERILSLLSGFGGHTADSMRTLQFDTYSQYGANVVPALVEALRGFPSLTPNAVKISDALAGWDFECRSGLEGIDPATATALGAAARASARGCLAFHTVMPYLRSRTFGDELARGGFANALGDETALYRLILRPESLSTDAYWDNVNTAATQETMADQVAAAFDDAGTQLATALGDNVDEWIWGRVHHLLMPADLFSAAGLTLFDNGPYVSDGGAYTVSPAAPRSPRTGDFTHSSGASMRLVCELLDDGPACTLQIPGGQRHYRDSPHYDDLLRGWLTNESFALIDTLAAAEAAAVETVELGPPAN